jgi:hypothetical protein
MINTDATVATITTAADPAPLRHLCIFFPPEPAEARSLADRQATGA